MLAKNESYRARNLAMHASKKVSSNANFCEWTSNENNIWQWHRMEKSKQASSGYNDSITTQVGLKETEESKACTRLIRKKSYELVRFLRSYKVQRVKFFIHSDRCDVRMDI